MIDQKNPFDDDKQPSAEEEFEADKKSGYYKAPLEPETPEETIRKTGLAWSAVTSLVVSIILFLIVGWLLDSFFGTEPYFLLGGIIFGSLIGFIQFFRTTSSIFRK